MKQIMKVSMILILFILTIVGCREDEPVHPDPPLKFAQSELTLKVGETKEMSFSGGDGKNYSLTKRSELLEITLFTSTKKLKIKALKAGSASIELKSGDQKALLKIQIAELPSLKAGIGIYDLKGAILLHPRYQLQRSNQVYLGLKATTPSSQLLILPAVQAASQGEKITLKLRSKGSVLSLPEGESSFESVVEHINDKTVQVLISDKNWRLILPKVNTKQ